MICLFCCVDICTNNAKPWWGELLEPLHKSREAPEGAGADCTLPGHTISSKTKPKKGQFHSRMTLMEQ